MRFKNLIVLLLVAAVAAPLAAQDEKKRKKRKKGAGRRGRTQQVVNLPRAIKLTKEQQEKMAAINKEYGPKLREIFRKVQGVYTADQKKARRTAGKEARKAGKKGKALREAVTAALNVTKEQQKEIAELNKAVAGIRKEAMTKVTALLTDEQKQQLKEARKKGRKKGKKKRRKKKVDN